MELQELYHLIGLQPEIIQKLEEISGKVDLEHYHSYLEQLTERKTAPQSYESLKILFQEDKDNLKMLYCQLECARRVFAKYQEKNIPEAVYTATMKCFTRFMEECKKKNGRMFFDRGWWTYRQISMNIFRIGELEYEFVKHEGKNAVGIHIPSDADLSKEAVDHSLKQADLFFQTYYHDYKYEKYTCDSWLLAPVLKQLLPADSNIVSFQNRFEIIRESKQEKEYMEWLYQVPADTDYKALPADTSLQRKVKELLLSGGAVGSAYGIINI